MATTTNAEVWDCTAAEYHADTEHTSNSMLKVLDESPSLFYGRFISKTIPQKESASMRLGTLLHIAALEPDRWANSLIPIPDCDRRTKDGKAAWVHFCQEAADDRWDAFCAALGCEPEKADKETCIAKLSAVGREVLEHSERALVGDMREALYANDSGRAWLECEGQREHSIRWQHDETGLMLKSRRDLVSLSGVLADLKTMAGIPSPANFARQAASFRYYRQAAFYIDGQRALAGHCDGLVFVAVSTAPPHDVACYELSAADIDRGRKENNALLADLARRCDTDDWQPAFSREIQTLSLPRWLDYQSEYEV